MSSLLIPGRSALTWYDLSVSTISRSIDIVGCVKLRPVGKAERPWRRELSKNVSIILNGSTIKSDCKLNGSLTSHTGLVLRVPNVPNGLYECQRNEETKKIAK